jgi:hypothetical protein
MRQTFKCRTKNISYLFLPPELKQKYHNPSIRRQNKKEAFARKRE